MDKLIYKIIFNVASFFVCNNSDVITYEESFNIENISSRVLLYNESSVGFKVLRSSCIKFGICSSAENESNSLVNFPFKLNNILVDVFEVGVDNNNGKQYLNSKESNKIIVSSISFSGYFTSLHLGIFDFSNIDLSYKGKIGFYRYNLGFEESRGSFSNVHFDNLLCCNVSLFFGVELCYSLGFRILPITIMEIDNYSSIDSLSTQNFGFPVWLSNIKMIYRLFRGINIALEYGTYNSPLEYMLSSSLSLSDNVKYLNIKIEFV